METELSKLVVWDDCGMGTCSLFVPLFQKELLFVFFTDLEKVPVVSPKMLAAVQDVLQLTTAALPLLEELLWEECIFAFTVADYGVELLEGEDPVQAHLRAFEITDKATAYQWSTLQEVHIRSEMDELQGRYTELKINSSAYNYISIIIKNGAIVDFDDDGTEISSFELQDNYAQQQRAQTLAN